MQTKRIINYVPIISITQRIRQQINEDLTPTSEREFLHNYSKTSQCSAIF